MPNKEKNSYYTPIAVLSNVSTSLPVLIIAVVAFTVYFNALFNDFVYDDLPQIVNNYALSNLGNLPRVFVEDVWSFMGGGHSNYYRPLMHAMYFINYAVFGLHPWGYHLINILIHTGVSVLVFFLSSRIFTKTGLAYSPALPFIAALLFATHPIHTEAVTWIACLPELSFTFLCLWSLYLYIGSVHGEHILSPRYYWLSICLFFLASLCKETALTLFLIVVVYDYCFAKNEYNPFRYLKRYIPFLLTAGLYLAMRTIVLSGFAPQKRHSALSAYEYFINVFPLFARYLEKLVLPIHLKVYYVFHPISSLMSAAGIVSLAVTLAFAVAAFAASRKNKPVLFYLMIIAVPLLPVLYIPALGENTFTERYLYLSSFGFVLLVAHLAGWLGELKPQAAKGILTVLLVVAVVYSIGTVRRNMVWKNELTLWTDAVAKSPEGVQPHIQLGNAYSDQGNITKALEQYKVALKINPDFADTYANIGLMYKDMGQLKEALDYFQKAVQLDQTIPIIYNDLGVVYEQLGMVDKAITSFQESLRLNAKQPGVYNNLGNAYAKTGQLDKAIQEFHNALRIQENDADAYNNLGIAYAKKGLPDEAIGYFKAALQINPNVPGYHNNIANVYSMKGMTELAAEHRRIALQLRSKN